MVEIHDLRSTCLHVGALKCIIYIYALIRPVENKVTMVSGSKRVTQLMHV